MTYGDIKTHLLDLCSQGAGGEFETWVGRTVNNVYRRVQAEVQDDNATDEVSFTTVSGTSQYGMPINVLRILNIDDGTANRSLEGISSRQFDKIYPGTTTSGTPRKYYELFKRGVQKQLTANGTVVVASSSTADDGGDYTVRVQGLDANTIWQDEQLELDGTTDVTSTTTFAEIRSVTVTATSGNSITGTITLSDDGSTTILARIPPSIVFAEHQWIELYPNPDDARSLTVRCIERKQDLINDDDWPQFDDRFHELLILGSNELLVATGKPDQAGRMRADFEDKLSLYKGTTQRRPNRVQTFVDVQNMPSISPRPLIPGVDVAR